MKGRTTTCLYPFKSIHKHDLTATIVFKSQRKCLHNLPKIELE